VRLEKQGLMSALLAAACMVAVDFEGESWKITAEAELPLTDTLFWSV
jgi:hypothetical protein